MSEAIASVQLEFRRCTVVSSCLVRKINAITSVTWNHRVKNNNRRIIEKVITDLVCSLSCPVHSFTDASFIKSVCRKRFLVCREMFRCNTGRDWPLGEIRSNAENRKNEVYSSSLEILNLLSVLQWACRTASYVQGYQKLSCLFYSSDWGEERHSLLTNYTIRVLTAALTLDMRSEI